MSNFSEVQLGYWDQTWKGQPIRLLLEYLGIQYSETLYAFPSEADKWFKEDKQNLRIPFPNLPYLIDGQTKITEYEAITHYVAVRGGKPELNGVDSDFYIVQQVKGVCSTIIEKLWYSKDKQGEDKKQDVDIAFYHFQNLLNLIGNKEWALSYLSVADFCIYTVSKEAAYYLPEEFKEKIGDKLQKYWERFESIPQIRSFQQSDRCIKYGQTSH